ncbi:MAG: high frequency lysogenization protein HflD [Moraxellaceae bacterium]
MKSDSKKREKILALAAILQAASLADSMAWRGHCDPISLECSLESLLVFDTDDTTAIYGKHKLRGLRVGITALEQALMPPMRHPHPRGPDILRYALAIIHLERKLARNPDMLKLARSRLERATQQRQHFEGLKELGMLRNFAGIYVDTLGTLKFRIQVKGDKKLLQTSTTQEQVRAILLAGIRAAWLWHRLGGRRWHLMLTRGSTAREVREIIKESI